MAMFNFVLWCIVGVIAVIQSSLNLKCSWIEYFLCYGVLMIYLADKAFF